MISAKPDRALEPRPAWPSARLPRARGRRGGKTDRRDETNLAPRHHAIRSPPTRAPCGEGGANRARAIQSIFCLAVPPCRVRGGRGVRIVRAQSNPFFVLPSLPCPVDVRPNRQVPAARVPVGRRLFGDDQGPPRPDRQPRQPPALGHARTHVRDQRRFPRYRLTDQSRDLTLRQIPMPKPGHWSWRSRGQVGRPQRQDRKPRNQWHLCLDAHDGASPRMVGSCGVLECCTESCT
jgi:hypothetical protein